MDKALALTFQCECFSLPLGRPDSIWMFSLSLSLHTNFLFLFFHFHFLSDCRKLYGRATGHLSITICPSLCPPPISAYSLYKETNPESLFEEKVIKCAIGKSTADNLCQRLFFHILVLLAIEQQCIEIFWAAGRGSRSRKCTICPFPGPPPVATTLQPLNPCQTPHQKVWAEVVKRPKNRLKNIMVACVEVIG